MSISSFYKEKIGPYVGHANTGGTSFVDLPSMIKQTKAKLVAPEPVQRMINNYGVNAKAPEPITGPNMTLRPQDTATTTKTSSNAQTLALQKSLNQRNAGQTGWVPLVEDGIMGPKTQAAQTWKPTTTTGATTMYNTPAGPVAPTITPTTTTTPTKPVEPPIDNRSMLETYKGMATQTPEQISQINKDLTQIKSNIQKSKENYAKARTDLYAEPGGIVLKEGRDRLLQEQYRMEQSALSEQANALADQLAAANVTYGTQLGAVGTATGFTQPQMQFGQLTSPQTGTPVSGGMYGSNPQLQTAVAQAVQLAQQVGPNDPQVQALLSTFGLPGQSLFTQAMNQVAQGTYNPAAMSAIAGQNIGMGTEYQAKAVALDVPIKQMEVASKQLTDFMTGAGINMDSQTWKNRTYREWMMEVQSPQDKATLNGVIAAVKNYLSQIIAADTGLNVNAVTADVESYTGLLENMTGAEIQQFLNNMIKEGQTRKDEFDKASLGGYTAGTTPYYGSVGGGGQSLSVGGIRTTPDTTTDKGLVGNVIMNKLTGIPGMIEGLFTKLFR